MIGHIAGIDLLGFLTPFPDAVNGLCHRHILMEIQKFRRHNAARGILRIFEELVDELSGLRLGVFEHPLYHHSRHFLQHIYRIIHKQILNDGPQFLIGNGRNDILLGLRLQLRKDVAGLILWQGAEAGDLLKRRQLLHKFRHIHFIGIGDHFMELCKLFCFQQLVELVNKLLCI